jgi:hypothetical protein
MKTYRSNSGPFTEKPFFKVDEIESICADELQKLGLYPSEPTAIRIDRFIEKRFGIKPDYLDIPDGLLGFTLFGKKGVEQIVIAKFLDKDERRLRTTLAHEGGHGLLHAHLFVLGTRPDSLFGDGIAADAPKILCRNEGVSGFAGNPGEKPPYRWYEFQANQAMGALLLPKELVRKALASMLTAPGTFGNLSLPATARGQAVQVLVSTFDVNPIVAKIRLEALYPTSEGRQLTL